MFFPILPLYLYLRNRLDKAKEDLERALEFEPNDKAIQKELHTLKQKDKVASKKQQRFYANMFEKMSTTNIEEDQEGESQTTTTTPPPSTGTSKSNSNTNTSSSNIPAKTTTTTTNDTTATPSSDSKSESNSNSRNLPVRRESIDETSGDDIPEYKAGL